MPKRSVSTRLKTKPVLSRVDPTSRKVYADVGVEKRYLQQLCHYDGCHKYIASHCEGYCMRHFKERKMLGIDKGLPKKKKPKSRRRPQTKEKKEPSERDRLKHLRKIKPDDVPKPQPQNFAFVADRKLARGQPKRPSSVRHESPKAVKRPSPSKQEASTPSKKGTQLPQSPGLTASGRKKPTKSLYPKSNQNEYGFPTGHAVAHLPSEPAAEFGVGWTTRTLPRANSMGSKSSDT